MNAWHEVAAAPALKPGEMTHAQVGTKDILVVNVDGQFHAFVNRCGHQNAPMDQGTFKSGVLKCPLHNAVFDARTGEVRGPPVFGGSGFDPAQLPKPLLEALGRTMAIVTKIPCEPLTPVPVDAGAGQLKVWV